MTKKRKSYFKTLGLGATVFLNLFAITNSNAQNALPTSGNVGIGTTSPIHTLHIKSTSPVVYLENSNNTFYSLMYNDPSGNLRFHNSHGFFLLGQGGNLGVGTASPSSRLHVYDSGKDAVLRLQSAPRTGFGSAGVEFWSDPTGATNEWRPGGIKSFDMGGFVGGLSFYTNGQGFSQKTAIKEAMKITDGKVIVGDESNNLNTTSNSFSLFVRKGILTERIKVAVANSSSWADYVFDKNYKLSKLSEVESYILKNKHLPGIPSADEMVENGLDVLQMNAKLLEKIEELTLYTIELNKKYEALENKFNESSK